MGKYREYDAEFKARVVLEVLQGQKSAAEACREYGIAADLLSRWKQDFVKRAPELFRTKQVQSAEVARIAELERLVGQLTLELSAVKKVSSLLSSRSSNGGKS
jgi:transposase-like protein